MEFGRIAKKLLIAALLVLAARAPADAALIDLDDKGISRTQFLYDATTNPDGFSAFNTLFSSSYSFDGTNFGTVRSQVFQGHGTNSDLYAYLYQVTAPNKRNDNVTELRIPEQTATIPGSTGFVGGPQEATIGPAPNPVDSINISSGVSAANPLGGFTINGTVEPNATGSTGVRQNTAFDPVRISFLYSLTNIPFGGTGYIVGLFSTLQPQLATLLVYDDNNTPTIRSVTGYLPVGIVPEPGSLVLMGMGVMLLGGARLLRRRLSMRPIECAT